MGSGSFESGTNKICLQIIFSIYMYKQDLALNNPLWVIYHKTKSNQTKPNQTNVYSCNISYMVSIKHLICVDELVLYFDLLTRPKMPFQRWCTGRRWHILMAVMRGNRVGGNWLMKWDELKKFPWYTHRLMHRKRVTSELHDSYFRLMTIKHSISKIEWASNGYITQLSSGQLSSSFREIGRRRTSCGR